jgi:hypothetical protein
MQANGWLGLSPRSSGRVEVQGTGASKTPLSHPSSPPYLARRDESSYHNLVISPTDVVTLLAPLPAALVPGPVSASPRPFLSSRRKKRLRMATALGTISLIEQAGASNATFIAHRVHSTALGVEMPYFSFHRRLSMTRRNITCGVVTGACSPRAPRLFELGRGVKADTDRVQTNGQAELSIGWSQGIAVMLKNLGVPHMHLIRAECHDETEPDHVVGKLRCLSD